MVGNNHVIGKTCSPSLGNQKRSKQQRMFANFKFAGVELGNNVVNVENDFAACQLGNKGGEHFEVRNRMYVHQLVRVPQVPPRQKKSGSEKEEEQSKHIRQSSAFISFPTLYPKYLHASNYLLNTLMRAA
jgi:hypothetical protein